jgi:hypothetical protein
MDLTAAPGTGKGTLLCLVGLCLFAAGIVRAEDLTTIEGKTYKGVAVTKVEPDGLSLSHETGTVKIPFAKLPEEVQRQHGFDPVKADAYAKEQKRRWAELQAAIEAAKEKEAAAKRAAIARGFTVTPKSAEGISLVAQSRAQVHEERAAGLRVELYREDEIARMLKESRLKGRLQVTWRRDDYDGAATEYFRVIVTDASGKVLERVSPEYRAPKQSGETDYANGTNLDMEYDAGEEFRVRVVDRNLKVHADFTVRKVL